MIIMSKTIGIIAIKGGVGKTTISSSLAVDLANNYNKKVLLIDANYGAPNLGLHMDILEPQKTIHEVLANNAMIESAIHSRFGVDVIPGSYNFPYPFNPLKLRNRIRKISRNYDFVVIDSSPSLNEEVLSTMLASDILFAVSTPDYPTLSCTLKASKLAFQRGRPIAGIILNKVREPKYELNMNEIEKTTNIPIVAKIHDDKMPLRAVFTRIPVPLYDKHSRFAKEINGLSAALTNTKEKRSFFARVFLPHFRKEQVNRQILKQNFYRRQFV